MIYYQFLKYGDILSYRGHTFAIYDLEYDENGNVIDAYTEVGLGVGAYVNTKFNGSTHHFLFHRQNRKEYQKSTTISPWKELNENKYIIKKNEYSILRFVDVNNNGDIVLNYYGQDAGYDNKNYDNEIIDLSSKIKDRVKFSNIYIEKTVDVHSESIVAANNELTYTIVVKNKSDKNYTDDIIVTENISDYVTYKNYTINKQGIDINEDLENKKLEWNIGKLNSGEEVIIKYTVTVKENCYGETIESTGKVANIPSTIVKNKIENNLTESQANIIQEKYNDLKNQYVGKELINMIYKETFGIDLDLTNFDITDLIKDYKSKVAIKYMSLNENNKFYNIVLGKY